MNAPRKTEAPNTVADDKGVTDASERMSSKAYDKALEKLHVELVTFRPLCSTHC